MGRKKARGKGRFSHRWPGKPAVTTLLGLAGARRDSNSVKQQHKNNKGKIQP